MEIQKTSIEGLLVLIPKVFRDDRGYFFESYHAERYREAGIPGDFVQDNESMSKKGVVRGLHYQLHPFAQGKLIRVILGCVFDVAVDLRRMSPTFGKWFGVELSAENKKQLFIPGGFAHGFSVLSDTVIFSYKCDRYYDPQQERGVAFDDPDLGIDWKIPESEMIVSDKDRKHKRFRDAEFNF